MDAADARGASSSAAAAWERLSWDLMELILAKLPLRAMVRAAAVCKNWRAVVTHPAFPARAGRRRPWFFLHGQNNVVLRLNRAAFGYDPDAGEWVAFSLPPSPGDCFAGAGGLAFAAPSPSRFAFAPLLRGAWQEAPPLGFSRCNPLVGVFDQRFLVVGGARFIGGLVDIEERLAAELYDPAAGAWELCPPLPAEFRSGNSSSQWLSAALVAGRFYVYGIYSCALSGFDLGRRAWTGVRLLRPPGLLFAFLAACGGRLVLAGLCADDAAAPCFAVWDVDPNTLAASKVGVMPPELLGCLFDAADDDDNKFASLKCVGLDGLVYVFNEDHHKAYPACVCEISGDVAGGGLTCTWRKVPPFPGTVSRFHKMVAFCSPVLLDAVLASGNDDAMH